MHTTPAISTAVIKSVAAPMTRPICQAVSLLVMFSPFPSSSVVVGVCLSVVRGPRAGKDAGMGFLVNNHEECNA